MSTDIAVALFPFVLVSIPCAFFVLVNLMAGTWRRW